MITAKKAPGIRAGASRRGNAQGGQSGAIRCAPGPVVCCAVKAARRTGIPSVTEPRERPVNVCLVHGAKNTARRDPLGNLLCVKHPTRPKEADKPLEPGIPPEGRYRRHARTSDEAGGAAGHRSGRNSDRAIPVARSNATASSAEMRCPSTNRLIADCDKPLILASLCWLPAFATARSTGFA